MAAALLKQLGEKALRPVKVGDIWHKAAVSAKNLAKERKLTLLGGRPWEFDQETAGQGKGYRRKLKGHKHDKLASARQDDIRKNLEGMGDRIKAYRESRKLKESSILDQLLMTPKQRRLKQYRETK